MHALHITPYFAPAFRYGGPPRSVLGLCRGLRDAGVGVEVITTAADGEGILPVQTDCPVEYDGIRVTYLSPAFPRRFFGARLRAALSEALPRADLCHIHGLWNVPEWAAARAARSGGVPYVLSPRGMLLPAALGHRRWRKRLAMALFERANVRHAALLHATSAPEADALAAVAPGRPIVTIPNGVDMDRCETGAHLRARLGIPTNAFVVLSLGRLHRIKRLDLVAGAFGHLRRRVPSAHLILAGPDEGGLLEGLMASLADHREFVHATGAVADSDRPSCFAAADVVVQCSDAESFGMVTVEAMAAGRAVVVTRTCPWPEIDARQCGYVVDQTEEAIADGLARLAAHPADRQAMGLRGVAYVRDRFAWPMVARRMMAAYTEMLMKRGRDVA